MADKARKPAGVTKWIIVTGGVLSGLGKGVAAASIGNLLAHEYKVTPIKCDGYLNADPGTMNPIEHGEVFVLDDGGEVDMDFGHYERFLGVTCKREWNLTMGKVFDKIRKKERKGDYLGKTVQMIPHVTDLIQDWWEKIATEEKSDVMLVEIGGTVGDIENELYIEAARQFKNRTGRENIMYVHLTYVPMLDNVHEQKSKPTQQSVSLLRARGIEPDLILARCHDPLDERIKEKIATFSNLAVDQVFEARDAANVYQVPLLFAEQGMQRIIAKKLGLAAARRRRWEQLVKKLEEPKSGEVKIAICGKYTALEDSYASVVEALKHAGAHHDVRVTVAWLETSEKANYEKELAGVSGVIVPGGFGGRGVEGKIKVVQYCRENKIPFLGICYGLQMAVIDHARNVIGMKDANTTENSKTKYPVVDILPEQKKILDKGGTMRLGAYPAKLIPNTLIHELYGVSEVRERHRHRYEVNPKYHDKLLNRGMLFSGLSPDGALVEFLERTDHPYFVATQAHPELKSSLLQPAPLFDGLVKAAKELRKK